MDDTRSMLGVVEDDEEHTYNKEFDKSRIQKNECDVQNLVSLFQTFNVFSRESEDLVCLTTGDIANEEIARDLLNAENLGQQVIKKLVMERLLEKTVSLHSSITKQKLKTFASMFVIQMAKDKHKQTTSVIKAARDLLLCPWRPEDLDALLQTELCHVLLSQ